MRAVGRGPRPLGVTLIGNATLVAAILAALAMAALAWVSRAHLALAMGGGALAVLAAWSGIALLRGDRRGRVGIGALLAAQAALGAWGIVDGRWDLAMGLPVALLVGGYLLRPEVRGWFNGSGLPGHRKET